MIEELFFEIKREKAHYFLDASESTPVRNLKEEISRIIAIPASRLTLIHLKDDGSRVVLEPNTAHLVDFGFRAATCGPSRPATLALKYDTDEDVTITPMSSPPPLPERY